MIADPFSSRIGARAARLALLAAALAFSADSRGENTAGDAERGRALAAYHGCGSCHAIRGLPGARGRVGPPLENIGERTYLAGVLPNTPENMIAWLRNPPRIVPGTAMPDLGLSEREARDIAAYLYRQ